MLLQVRQINESKNKRGTTKVVFCAVFREQNTGHALDLDTDVNPYGISIGENADSIHNRQSFAESANQLLAFQKEFGTTIRYGIGWMVIDAECRFWQAEETEINPKRSDHVPIWWRQHRH